MFVIAHILSSILPLVPSLAVAEIFLVLAFVIVLLRKKETPAVSLLAPVQPESFVHAPRIAVHQSSDAVWEPPGVHNPGVQSGTVQLVRDGLIHHGVAARVVAERGRDRRRRFIPGAQEMRIAAGVAGQ